MSSIITHCICRYILFRCVFPFKNCKLMVYWQAGKCIIFFVSQGRANIALIRIFQMHDLVCTKLISFVQLSGLKTIAYNYSNRKQEPNTSQNWMIQCTHTEKKNKKVSLGWLGQKKAFGPKYIRHEKQSLSCVNCTNYLFQNSHNAHITLSINNAVLWTVTRFKVIQNTPKRHWPKW